MKKFYPINLIKVTKIENKNCKSSKKGGYLQYRYNFTEPYTYFLVGMTQKEREEGANHTLLAVGAGKICLNLNFRSNFP